ncbi:MAG: PQQ-dependent sugar dehydrogenase [Patescibacteria group bacterium]
MTKRGRIILFLSALIILTAAVLFFYRGRIFKEFYSPTETQLPFGVENAPKPDVEIIAENLQIPWEIAFLPEGDLLATERPGTLKRIGKEGRVYNIEGVEHIGEGGLLGMALHPQFAENRWIYLYLTTKVGDELKNRVERYYFQNDRLSDKKIIIDNIPGASHHDGGRIAFGPDGNLYITAGDAGNSQLAQDVNSFAGKILRLSDDGSIPSDNPFGNAVYSYGHRNPQGLAWDDKNQLWATEHGRSGILSGLDELNLIQKGKNYGWPIIQGPEIKTGMISPVAQSGADETWAPAGAVFWNGSIFFTGLRGESIYEAKIADNGKITAVISHFRGAFGRLRAIQIGPDGFMYVSASNTDGRGEVRGNDDKIIKINPKIFKEN